ncbi:MAG: sigma-70 family RNA polymerase sigma factor [Candidatus Aminicenantes bacterium]|nr:MAG: sigma-70 family RNA polymerase sigma factor [Candidatus Aminicenantes bacterium]
MLRYQNGDIDSFEMLYRRYEKPLLDFIYRMVMNPSEAENLHQETFYRVIRSKKKYKATALFKTWLFQIAINLCRDRLRRLKHRSHLSLNSPAASHNDKGVELHQLISDPSSDVVKQMESEELVSLVKGAIASLPEKENLVFIMKEYQGMKFSEIADILNCPLGTLMSLNYRAIEKLKKTLSKYVGD